MAEIFPLFRYFSVSSVIDKDNSQSDWRKDFFITEETEIIGNDERVRTKLYLYRFCRARRRKTIVKINGIICAICAICER
jgi:hypothetical protein